VQKTTTAPHAPVVLTGHPGEIPLRVSEISEPAEGVRLLVLRHAEGDPLPRWSPGAHVDLILPGGLSRPYSLCGDPGARNEWRVAVLREPDSRGGSLYIHASLHPNDVIAARMPLNNFPLEPADEYLLIAGGIGITPLLPMIAQLAADRAQWRLLYGGRRRASMAFVGELRRYGERVTLVPEDECGLPDITAWLGDPRPAAAIYCCGPAGLIAAVEGVCDRWPVGALHVERFRADPAALAGEDTPFEVVAARSGVTVEVASDETIVEALDAAGVYVPTSCGEGTCETCLCQVLEGEADHRDSALTDQQRADGAILPCCSRSRTPVIVLDV
jgi:ferredoxin-NADP reductase